MYKYAHGFTPQLLCDMIMMASVVYERNIRNTNSHNINILKCNDEWNLNLFKYARGKVWRGVPYNKHNMTSVEAFIYVCKKNHCQNNHTK